MTKYRQLRPSFLSYLLLTCALFGLFGCSTYSSSLRPVQDGVYFGQNEEALAVLNHIDPKESTSQVEKSGGLLELERATLEQSLGSFDDAANNFTQADNSLEYFDISAYDRVDIAKWLFSDDSYTYSAPAYERLLVYILNMINFVALENLEDGRVEARRFQKGVEFYVEREDELVQFDIVAIGYYLGGYIFEMSSQFDEAWRFYSSAMVQLEGAAKNSGLVSQITLDDLEAKITEMMRLSGQRRPLKNTPLLDRSAEAAQSLGALTRADYLAEHKGTDTLVVVQTGMVPYKTANYLPIGAAVTLALAAPARFRMSDAEFEQAKWAMARGAITTVNVPTLVDEDVPYNPPYTLTIGGVTPNALMDVDVTAQVYTSWESLQPIVVGSALTRALVRLAAGEGANQIAKVSGADESFGQLAALLIQGGLAAADRPDTRSWILLPSNIFLYRFDATSPISVDFQISLGSEKREVTPGGTRYKIINFSKYRR